MSEKLYQNKEWLEEQYWGKGLSVHQIEDMFGYGHSSIHRWLVKHGIPRKSQGRIKVPEQLQDREWLYEQYWGKKLGAPQIAELVGCHSSTVIKWMEKLGVPIRTKSEAVVITRAYHDAYNCEEYRRRQSEARKAAWACGVFDSEDTRCKKSEAMKAAWARGAFDCEETRRRMSKAKEMNWACGVYDNEEYRRKLSKATKAAWTRGDFDNAFQSPTGIELQVAAALDILGLEHESQFRPDGYSRIYDEFVLPDVLLEVNGCYWHGCPCRLVNNELDDIQMKSRESDAEKATWAAENGYHLVTIWEHEINERGAWSIVIERVLPLLEEAT